MLITENTFNAAYMQEISYVGNFEFKVLSTEYHTINISAGVHYKHDIGIRGNGTLYVKRSGKISCVKSFTYKYTFENGKVVRCENIESVPSEISKLFIESIYNK